MSPFKILLAVLICLLLIMGGLAFSPQVPAATGIPHPEFGTNILIAPNNIDQEPHTRWMGYLYGLGILGIFWSFLTIGTRKNGKKTVMVKWISICFVLYILVYTMIHEHASTYRLDDLRDVVYPYHHNDSLCGIF